MQGCDLKHCSYGFEGDSEQALIHPPSERHSLFQIVTFYFSRMHSVQCFFTPFPEPWSVHWLPQLSQEGHFNILCTTETPLQSYPFIIPLFVSVQWELTLLKTQKGSFSMCPRKDCIWVQESLAYYPDEIFIILKVPLWYNNILQSFLSMSIMHYVVLSPLKLLWLIGPFCTLPF